MSTRTTAVATGRAIGVLLVALGLVASIVPAVAAQPGASRARPGEAQERSGLPWSSGVTPVDVLGANAERFGVKRGAPVDNIVVYPGRESWRALLSTFWTSALPSYFVPAQDDLVVSLPLWPASRNVRNTGSRQQWKALGSNIAASDPDAYVRLGWEMNINAFHWALRPANAQAWVSAFRRSARLITKTCPGCRIVWNPNHGRDQTGASSRAAFFEVKGLVDVYAIDDYDIYPPIKDAESRRRHMNDYGQWNESLRFARAQGKKFAVPEWGIACNGPRCQWRGNAGGDNPLFIRAFMRWFEQNARFIAFESYFDEPTRSSRSSLYTRPMGPRAGRAYRAEITRVLAR